MLAGRGERALYHYIARTITVYVNIIVDVYQFIDWFISENVLVISEGLNGVCRYSGLGKK